MINFWKSLSKPIFILAPMADVTDAAFRQIIVKYGKPDVFYTEFVSADGLCSQGKEKLLIDLKYSQNEHPIVAQLFTSNIENMRTVASMVIDLGFDGVDINMGCPDRNVEKQGAGASLIKTPDKAIQIIEAAIDGAKGRPVSVKTRVGYSRNEIDTWIPKLLGTNISALVVHARTRKEMSSVPARWEDIKRVVKLRDKINPNVIIVGNGDVDSLEDGRQKAGESGADGVMIGRGIFGNPWLFSEKVPSLEEKLNAMIEHTELFQIIFGDTKNFAVMKKHYKAYVCGFDKAKELRMQLMESKNAREVKNIVQSFLSGV